MPNLFCNFGIDERQLNIRVAGIDYSVYFDDFVNASTFIAYCNAQLPLNVRLVTLAGIYPWELLLSFKLQINGIDAIS